MLDPLLIRLAKLNGWVLAESVLALVALLGFDVHSLLHEAVGLVGKILSVKFPNRLEAS